MTIRDRMIRALPGKSRIGKLLSRRFYHRPIFVVGDGRSGTSALVDAISQHPQVFGRPKEGPVYDYVGRVFAKYGDPELSTYYGQCSELQTEEVAAILRRFLFETMWGADFGYRLLLRRRRSLGWAYRRKSWWVVKAFPIEEGACGLRALYPLSRFIYIHRCGTEVVQSKSKYKAFRDRSFERNCRDWAACVEQYRDLRNWDCFHEVRQADLRDDPERILAGVQDFIGLEPSDAPATFCRTTLVHPLDQQTSSGVDVTRLLKDRAPAHSKWTDEQKEVFRRICADGMAELGYEMPF